MIFFHADSKYFLFLNMSEISCFYSLEIKNKTDWLNIKIYYTSLLEIETNFDNIGKRNLIV